jgi:hypothetical protein
VQALAVECQALIDGITGGDAGIGQGLTAMYRSDPEGMARFLGPDVDRGVFEYLGKARRSLQKA